MPAIILFAPLVGALICGFGWRFLGERPAIVIATGLMFLAMALSWAVFLTFDTSAIDSVPLFRWIESGSMSADWAVRLDTLTAIMLVVITTVSAFVHLYSFGYMAGDANFKPGESFEPRFFAYLSFFTFAMLMLVTADNLVQMFFGWEGVGLASYLLIGFYWRKGSANAAAIKAFVVNRVGDFGFLMGIFALYLLVDAVDFDTIFAAAPEMAETSLRFLWRDWNAVEVVSVLLFIGAMGKSAQLFLHTWLPDAMEGPTPVSALIHAATMVTAGVFLVCRMSPVLEWAPYALAFITYIGAFTAFFAASVALVQNDIKRVIAYSTCSQLGYMFVAAGVGAYPVAMFHLFTHAWFKALLFLGAGSVIHAMHHEQDMRAYGGLRTKIPLTFTAMLAGTLAITGLGIPLTHIGFAGFLSKDAVIESAWAGGTEAAGLAFWLLVVAAAMTSFYSWRLIFLTFLGAPRGDHHTHDHAHESPRTMLIPLAVLGLGAVFSGMIWYGDFFGDDVGAFFGPSVFFHPENSVIHDAHYAPVWVRVAPFVAMALGLGVAVWFYILSPSLPAALARSQAPLYRFLYNKWYFDEIYGALIVRPVMALGRTLWKGGDGRTIDGGINGLAMGIVPYFTRLAGRAQSGYIFHYAFAMVLGLLALILILGLAGAR
ncbi:NADH-quinone oxidoreductase subunit L [soil metagenome]